jgi:hypothetical protein
MEVDADAEEDDRECDDGPGSDNEGLAHHAASLPNPMVGICLGSHVISSKPGFQEVTVDEITTVFHVSLFLPALTSYFHQMNPPPKTFVMPQVTDRFDAYKRVSIVLPNMSTVGHSNQLDRIRATPVAHTSPHHQPTCAHFDTVLVQTHDEHNEHTEGTALEGVLYPKLL